MPTKIILIAMFFTVTYQVGSYLSKNESVGPTSLAFVALISAIFGHLLSQFQFEQRIAHEVKLKKIEALKQIQREIYLSAAEEISRATTAIMRSTSGNIMSVTKGYEKLRLGEAVNKMSLIATEPTLSALYAFTKKFAEGTFELMLELARMQKAQMDGENLQQISLEKRSVIDQLLAELQIAESGQRDELQSHLQALKKHLEELADNQRQCNLDVAKSRANLPILALKALENMTDALCKLNVEVRKEMEFLINHEEYFSLVSNSMKDAKTAWSDYLNKLNKIFEI